MVQVVSEVTQLGHALGDLSHAIIVSAPVYHWSIADAGCSMNRWEMGALRQDMLFAELNLGSRYFADHFHYFADFKYLMYLTIT